MGDQRGKASESLEGIGFTPREHEVLQHVLRGETNKDIAAHLGRSLKTIELHVSRILKKVGHPTRIQLLAAILADDSGDQTLEHGTSKASKKKWTA